MGIGMMDTINQRIILRRSQERKSFMMNQATPHLGAGSSLMNDASGNCRRPPRMGTALTAEWMTSMNEPMHRKNKESFGIQTRAPYDDGASRRGGPIFQIR